MKFWRNVQHYLDIRYHRRFGGAPVGPMLVFLEVTRRCNSHCKHCDIWQTGKKNAEMFEKELNIDDFEKLFSDFQRMGVQVVDIFGGEPMMRRDIFQVIKTAKSHELYVTMTTNGSLFNDEVINKLLESQINQIYFSVDYPTAEQHDCFRGLSNAFHKIESAIKKLKKQKPDFDIGINTIVTAENLTDLSTMIDLAAKWNVDSVRYLLFHAIYPFNMYEHNHREIALNSSHLNELNKQVKAILYKAEAAGIYTNSESFLSNMVPYIEQKWEGLSCYAGDLFCDINAFGEVYPCYSLGQPVGDLHESTFREIWRSDKLAEFREKVRQGKCRKCYQSCYIEPSLRANLPTSWDDIRKFLKEIKTYKLG